MAGSASRDQRDLAGLQLAAADEPEVFIEDDNIRVSCRKASEALAQEAASVIHELLHLSPLPPHHALSAATCKASRRAPPATRRYAGRTPLQPHRIADSFRRHPDHAPSVRCVAADLDRHL